MENGMNHLGHLAVCVRHVDQSKCYNIFGPLLSTCRRRFGLHPFACLMSCQSVIDTLRILVHAGFIPFCANKHNSQIVRFIQIHQYHDIYLLSGSCTRAAGRRPYIYDRGTQSLWRFLFPPPLPSRPKLQRRPSVRCGSQSRCRLNINEDVRFTSCKGS